MIPPSPLAGGSAATSGGSRKILVGGRAFSSVRSAWREIGADGHAEGLAEAVEAARRLGPGLETSEPGP